MRTCLVVMFEGTDVVCTSPTRVPLLVRAAKKKPKAAAVKKEAASSAHGEDPNDVSMKHLGPSRRRRSAGRLRDSVPDFVDGVLFVHAYKHAHKLWTHSQFQKELRHRLPQRLACVA